MLTVREVLLAKIESTYNTDPSPVGTDAVLVENPQLSFNHRMHEQKPVKATMGALRPDIYGGGLAQITFDVLLRGSGAAGTAPEIGPLLRACGLSETIVASTSVTYAPATTSLESCTIYHHQDGMRHKLTGCRGTVTFVAEVGAPAKVSFTMQGHHAFDDSAVATPTFDASDAPPYINAAFSVDSYSAVIAALNMDVGNNVITPPSPSATDGYGEIDITDRMVTGSIDPEAVLVATYDFLGKFRAGSTFALDSGLVGATAGNKWRLQMPKVQYREIGQGDRDQKRTFDVGIKALETSGNDEFSLAFT